MAYLPHSNYQKTGNKMSISLVVLEQIVHEAGTIALTYAD
jgi:hypothetical protein